MDAAPSEARRVPPPRPCSMCTSADHEGHDVLIRPEPCIIDQSQGQLPGWRYTCRLCGAVREEPER